MGAIIRYNLAQEAYSDWWAVVFYLLAVLLLYGAINLAALKIQE